MRVALSVLSVALLLASSALSADESGEHQHKPAHEHAAPAGTVQADGSHAYGAAMPAEPAPVALAAVLAAPAEHVGKPAKVSGRIGKVCQKAGCWMSLTEGDRQVRVVFGDHAFTIPTDTVGEAVVYGVLEEKKISEDMARHLAEDAGQDPSKVQGEQVEYRLVATAVTIRS